MSLYGAMYTGVTGLGTNSQDLSVTSDNIANANTIGFKSSRAAFEDILGGRGIGLGARLQAVQRVLTQGALTTTGLATDLALQGDGFFVVESAAGERFYTRAGQFTLDDDGYMVNLSGHRVQGYGADAQGNVISRMGDLNLGNVSSPPLPTSSIEIRGNLDANQVDSGIPYDPNDPTSYDFSTSTTVYDSLGNAREVTVHYKKTANPGEWTANIVTDGSNVPGGTAGTMTLIDSQTLTFDTNGNLTSAPTSTHSFNFVGATQPQDIDLDWSGISQYGNPSSTSFIAQDGYAAGELAGVRIEPNGDIVGSFTNGTSRTVGQVAVADFVAADKLARAGGNLLKATNEAGEAVIGEAGTGGRGKIVAGALEQSNVDLANEFVRMIVAQRGFQANSKAVQTADTLLGELMQLKR